MLFNALMPLFGPPRVAFEQALDFDESCVGAMVGLAVLNLNERTRSRAGGNDESGSTGARSN